MLPQKYLSFLHYRLNSDEASQKIRRREIGALHQAAADTLLPVSASQLTGGFDHGSAI